MVRVREADHTLQAALPNPIHLPGKSRHKDRKTPRRVLLFVLLRMSCKISMTLAQTTLAQTTLATTLARLTLALMTLAQMTPAQMTPQMLQRSRASTQHSCASTCVPALTWHIHPQEFGTTYVNAFSGLLRMHL